MCIMFYSLRTPPLHVLAESGVAHVEAEDLKVQLMLLTLLAATFGSLQGIAAYSYGFFTQNFYSTLFLLTAVAYSFIDLQGKNSTIVQGKKT
jgi:hypothetical protein